jgi:hypothetical protein
MGHEGEFALEGEKMRGQGKHGEGLRPVIQSALNWEALMAERMQSRLLHFWNGPLRSDTGAARLLRRNVNHRLVEFWVSRCAPNPAGDGSLGNVKAQHEEFPMNARRTPGRVLSHHLEDQFTDLLGNPFSAANSLSHFAKHGPIPSESGPVPARDCFW